MNAEDVVRRAGGLATRGQLLAHLTPRQVLGALRAGEIVRVARGHYALPVVSEARAAAVKVGGVVSHLSAALHWGWEVREPPSEPTVIVPRGRNLSRSRRIGVHVHYGRPGVNDLASGVTGPVRTIIDCARTLPFVDALPVVDSALRAGVPRSLLHRAALASPRTGRPAVLRVVAAGSAKSANAFESVLRALAIEAGVEVEPQLECLPYLQVDVGNRSLRLALEAESWAYHGDRKPFDNDVRRYTLLVRHRWIVARFLWVDVMHRPERVRREIREIADWCAQLRQFALSGQKSA